MKHTVSRKVAATTTLEAVEGPKLVSETVEGKLLPITTGSGLSVTPRTRSAAPGITLAVVRVSIQPLAMLPVSKVVSSITKRFQAPLGLEPLQAERLVAYGAGGAGDGKAATGRTGLGRFVAVTIVPDAGTGVAALSSRVSMTLLIALAPPSLARISIFWPPGGASRISTSFGWVWLKLVSVTVALATTPFSPETLIVEGYGKAFVLSRIVIALLFVNR